MDNEAPPSAAPEAPEPDYSAGFWLRGGAYMIDGFLLALASLPAVFLPDALGLVARILIPALYFTLLPVSMAGQTLGMRAAGIAIVRPDGSPLSYGRAFVRWLGYLLSSILLGLGFLIALFTKNKRALHDYLADTRVVRVEEIGSARKAAVVFVGVLLPLLVALGLAAALAIPQFSALGARAAESAVRGRLGSLRSAAAVYYGDAKGHYPPDIAALVPKYLPELPAPGLAEHPGASGVEIYGPEVCSGQNILGDKLRDTGKWGYVVAPQAPCDGDVFVDCAHKDSKGRAWSSY